MSMQWPQVPRAGNERSVEMWRNLVLKHLKGLTASFTWNPGSLADGAGETSAAVIVAGAAFGDFAQAAAPYDLQDVQCTAYVCAAGTVRVRLQNETGGVVDLAEGTWKVKVTS